MVKGGMAGTGALRDAYAEAAKFGRPRNTMRALLWATPGAEARDTSGGHWLMLAVF